MFPANGSRGTSNSNCCAITALPLQQSLATHDNMTTLVHMHTEHVHAMMAQYAWRNMHAAKHQRCCQLQQRNEMQVPTP
jgi:hypothetical protein